MSGEIDREWVLADVSGEAPCGPDLEYDPGFSELNELMKGRPGMQLGDVFQPPEAPDWREAAEMAMRLLERAKDLRILVHLSQALPHTDGWASFAQCLAVIRELLRERWQDLHPQLDEEDRRDPRHRVSVLSDLAGPRALEQLGRVPLVGTVVGFPGLLEVRWARGEIRDDWWTEELDRPDIEQALATCSPADREAACRDLRQAQSQVWGIRRVFFEQSEGVRDLPLTDLLRLLLEAERILA